jgi:hypothetical protein
MAIPRSLRWLLLVVAVLLVAAFLALRELSLSKGAVSFLPSRTGTVALFMSPGGSTVLAVDGKAYALLEDVGARLPFFHRRIDVLLVPSTSDMDAMALQEFLKRYDVRRILGGPDIAALPNIKEILKASGTMPLWAEPDARIAIGDEVTLGFSGRDTKNPKLIIRTHLTSVELPGDARNLPAGLNASTLRGLVWTLNEKSNAKLAAVIIDSPSSNATSSPQSFIRNIAKEKDVSVPVQ